MMMMRKVLFTILALTALWLFLASRAERHEFIGQVKDATGSVSHRFVSLISGGFSLTDYLPTMTADRGNGTEPAAVAASVPDPNRKRLAEDTKVYDQNYAVIGNLRAGDTVRVISTDPEADRASIETGTGVTGLVPNHLLED